MVYRRLKTDSASLLPWSPASSWGPGGGRNCLLPPSGRRRRTAKKCIFRMLFKKEKSSLLQKGRCRTHGRFGCGGYGTAPTSENASPRVGNCGQMGFRGRRNAAGASSRPGHGRNWASSWPDPAAMCNDRAPPKKPPDASREPEEPNASSRLAGAQGGVLDADRASPAFAAAISN